MTELRIIPLVNVADLLIAIGLIGLGLCGFAIVITVEICYFRKGGIVHDAARNRKKRKELPDAGRSVRGFRL